MGLKWQICENRCGVDNYIMYVTLRWEVTIILLMMMTVLLLAMMLSMVRTCISLSFYAWPIGVRCMGVGLGHGSINAPGSGLHWVGSGSMKWTHGQL